VVTIDHDRTTPAVSRFWASATTVLAELNAATSVLSTSNSAGHDVLETIERLIEMISERTPEVLRESDPYLAEAFLVGAVGCAKAMWVGDEQKQRRELRLPLERTRQALRDLLDERYVAQDRPPKDVARWVVDVSGVSQQDIAALVHVAPRTLQRWISTSEAAAPSGEEEVRMRTLARIIDQLRWSMTPVGVVRWLKRPHPDLKGRPPAELLDQPGAYAELPKLAAATRAMVAS
jgi:uncharacterized protein (DUF2384 family)